MLEYKNHHFGDLRSFVTHHGHKNKGIKEGLFDGGSITSMIIVVIYQLLKRNPLVKN